MSVFLVNSTIYTAFKKSPAYNASDRTAGDQKMYFPRAFCESPSTMVMMSKAVDTSTFDNAHWFGDAASDAVSMFNVDFYTNKKFNSLRNVQGKYLAVGRYSAKSDWAQAFILEALSYKGKDTMPTDDVANPDTDDSKIGNYFLRRYQKLFNHKSSKNSGWCSEFAAVTLHDSKDGDKGFYPHNSYVKGFVGDLSSRARFFVAKSDNSGFLPATQDAICDTSSAYKFGGVSKKTGKDLSFSCTPISSGVQPEIGDLIFFANTHTCHTGIVINVNGSYVFTVEGNVDEQQVHVGTKKVNTVLHVRRRLTGTNRNELVGIGKLY